MILTFLLSFLLGLSQPIASEPASTIKLRITNCSSNEGLVRVLVYNQAVGFPENTKTAVVSYSLPIKGKHAEISIPDLGPGEYAISAYHDENEDGELEKHLLGYPTERYGFSNNPKITFSAPTYERCVFEIKENENKEVHIKLH
ncbi:DUF2141 domain-containing protein [Algoriphagus zhangzhouensis]|uniref:Uncharacterized conserved protein, DUF2141 family n=1 Tax=Algoriphagus zhangzhouensis TaxID=1073327 RepID=A0A1M7Z727_9BACT|nr:DUF2141 domain-containing protein [Algoriphagus zhangzhouensis]TDY49299.1 uncharacterized protein (DUF2141 family) [Algoriphagus zhangzhouensis]SHO60733.1 Uncharacterized conserved protein, DUF2141 family [Algoriphagus zhangzhouensis]